MPEEQDGTFTIRGLHTTHVLQVNSYGALADTITYKGVRVRRVEFRIGRVEAIRCGKWLLKRLIATRRVRSVVEPLLPSNDTGSSILNESST